MIPWTLLWKLAPWIGGALVVLGLVFGALHIKHEMDSIPGLKVEISTWKTAYAGEKAVFDKSEALRKSDQLAAIGSINAAQADCTVRIAEAKRSASAIRKIVNAQPKLDQNNCPVRNVIDPGLLQNALGAH